MRQPEGIVHVNNIDAIGVFCAAFVAVASRFARTVLTGKAIFVVGAGVIPCMGASTRNVSSIGPID